MKRFWKTVRAEEVSDGWTILLDSQPVKTPGRRPVTVPSRTIADEIVAEWEAQTDRVDPLSMPMMRAAATCLDRVAPEMAAVAADIAAYGEADLLCYRVDRPDELVARQAQAWDPVLDWADRTLGARLRVGAGIVHVVQPGAAVAALAAEVRRHAPWHLTALAEMTTISGSLVLALAVRHGRLDADEAWALSRIDEEWNIAHWGEDREAAEQAARRESDFRHAARLIRLLDGGRVPGDGQP